MMEPATELKLRIHKTSQADITYLQFDGTIDEGFDGSGVGQGLEGRLVVSLRNIVRITSFGIRQWLQFVGTAGEKCPDIYLVDCAPRIVDQLNMVTNFAGKAVVVSFYAPFRCEHCGDESLKLIQVDRDREMIAGGRLEGEACANDGKMTVLDDEPDVFLSYMMSQPTVEIPPDITSFLSSRGEYAVPEGLRRVWVSKKVKDRFTFISLKGDLGEDLPVGKIAEGLEGDVVFDLAAVNGVSPVGLERWRAMLATIAPATEKLVVIGLPALMLEGMSKGQDLAEKGQVLTLFLPYGCQSCAITSHQEINVAESYDDLRLATPPTIACPDCGRETQCVATEQMRLKLADLPAPAPDLNAKKLKAWARAPEKTQQAAPQLTSPASPTTSMPAQSRSWAAVVVIAAVVAVVAALLAVFVSRSDDSKGTIGKAELEGKLIESSLPSAPKWKDQVFTIEGGIVQATGQSGLATDKELAFQQAFAAAAEELCNQVGTSIRDPQWVEHVGSQFRAFRSKAVRDLETALVSGDREAIDKSRRRLQARRLKVSDSFVAGTSNITQLTSNSYYWEKVRVNNEIRYRVWSLVKISKGEFRRLVEYYAKRREALAAQAVTYFPGMAWRYNLARGAVVVGMKADSPLRHIGLLPGDILVSAQDRTIKHAKGFKRVLAEEYAALAESGGTMVVQVERGDAPIVAHQLRVAKKAAPTAPGKKTRPWRPTKRQTKRWPPANIWDDDPFQ